MRERERERVNKKDCERWRLREREGVCVREIEKVRDVRFLIVFIRKKTFIEIAIFVPVPGSF